MTFDPETTGTTENEGVAAGTTEESTGTAPEESVGPGRSPEVVHEEPQRYRVRDREMTLEELQAEAERASGLQYALEDRNKELREYRRRELEREVYEQEASRPQREQPEYRLPNNVPGLDQMDPENAATLAVVDLNQRLEDLRLQMQRQQIRASLTSEEAELKSRYGKEFTPEMRDECMERIRDGVRNGKRFGFREAFFQIRGERADQIAERRAEAQRDSQDRERRMNQRVLATGAVSGGGGAAQSREYTMADVEAMPLSEFARLEKEGYRATTEGLFRKVMP